MMTNTDVNPVFYRLVTSSSCGSGYVVILRFKGVKKTAKGWWILPEDAFDLMARDHQGLSDFKSQAIFILDDAGKKFAYPTLDAARSSFFLRQRRRILHLQAQLELATSCIAQMDAINAAGHDTLIELGVLQHARLHRSTFTGYDDAL